ncbi:MAG TPA: phosphoribosyl-AMP cyclohydrolase [Thermomicrobiales bacterium]|nr:phosphoribosyl-AMP cyclohydrolase [Thermomicrobiales bacterium]
MTDVMTTGTHGDLVRFGADGLIPATLQDAVSRRALMVGFMDATALAETRRTGLVHFWSRSRQKLWQKGETSGNVSRVREIRINCEQNSLLILVEQVGAICHDGYPTCYYRTLQPDDGLTIVEPRAFDPADVYGPAGERRASPSAVLSTWYAAYEYLRDHDLSDQSSTSRRLRGDDGLADRIVDELGELAGVIEGSHRHQGLDEDIALEGGQVLYWLAVLAVREGWSLEDLRLVEVLSSAGSSTIDGLEGEGELLRALACRWAAIGSDATPLLVRTTIAAVVRVAALRQLDVVDLVRGDVDSLRKRAYLDAYFNDPGQTTP